MQNHTLKIKITKFLYQIKSKKHHLKMLQNKLNKLFVFKEKNIRRLNSFFYPEFFRLTNYNFFIKYIITIAFLRTNTLLYLTNCYGHLVFSHSAGYTSFKNQKKRSRLRIVQELYKFLLTKFKTIKNKPIAVHFKNVGSNRFWIMKKLKTKVFISEIKTFNKYPLNGCRKRKAKRSKSNWRNG